MSEAHVTLYGDHVRRFREIQAALEQARGFEVSTAETVRALMSEWNGTD